jgi:hypothetical protein
MQRERENLMVELLRVNGGQTVFVINVMTDLVEFHQKHIHRLWW